jgi:hypothetical protein
MDTNTLRKAMRKLKKLSSKNHAVGVYAANRLPKRFSKPAAYIVHSENSDVDVGHWIAMYISEDGKSYYFDSYGLAPLVESHINFLHRNSKKLYINKKCYQAIDSTVCGGYCLLFLAYKMGVLKLPLCFDANDVDKNDAYVSETTNKLLDALENIKV